jgi:transcription antitermination factor NusG
MGACDQRWPWFAIQVRTSKETTVTNLLQNRDYECFLPLGKSRRRWSDRIKEFEVPLFPGYVFCRFDVHNRLPILKTPGVLQIVGVAKIPAPIDDAEITAIQCLGRSGLLTQQWPFLQVGQRARIDYGPLRGLTGIVVGIKSELKLVLSVALLQRSVAVEVDHDWLSELDESSPVATAVAPDRSFPSRQAIAPRRFLEIANPEGQLS